MQETHIIHKFNGDFYGSNLKICLVGFLRGEKNFNSLDDLIQAIKQDISDAELHLKEKEELKISSFFTNIKWLHFLLLLWFIVIYFFNVIVKMLLYFCQYIKIDHCQFFHGIYLKIEFGYGKKILALLIFIFNFKKQFCYFDLKRRVSYALY